jgi:hypothetical protein
MDNPDFILAFLQNHCPDLQLTEILSVVGMDAHHSETSRTIGWVRIQAIVARSSSGSLWDIDIRWTASPRIQQQQWVDWGWQEQTLLEPENLERHRLIVYLCDPGVGGDTLGSPHPSPLPSREREPETSLVAPAPLLPTWEKGLGDEGFSLLPLAILPPEFLIGRHWRSVLHLYTTNPHPFAIPPLDIRQDYSTTLNLVTAPPPGRAEIETALWQTAGSPQMETGGLRTQGLFKTAPEDRIFLSIVTVVYNGEKYLEQTIQSVLQQSYEHLEYIIIDGGSTDGTLDIIRKYEAYINYWVSDRDEGIYNAMNKGSRLASGSHVLHLNADDLLFASDCLDFLQNADPWRNYMNAILKLDIENGVVTKDAIGPTQGNLRDNAFHQNPWFKISRVGMTHPGFIGLLNENSLFPEQYKIMSDTIMLARKFEREPVEVSKQVLTIFRSGGASADNRQVLAEMGQEIKAASGLWQKLLVWLKLQGIFVFERDRGALQSGNHPVK